MRYDRSSQRQLGSAAGLTAIGVFPRHSTLIFKETLAVISLALALSLLFWP